MQMYMCVYMNIYQKYYIAMLLFRPLLRLLCGDIGFVYPACL